MTTYATVDPTTGRVVQEFDPMTDDDVRRSLGAAHGAYATWRERELVERAAMVGRVAELHRKHADELASLMTLEMGKPIAQALGEVELSASIWAYYAEKGPALLAEEVLDIAAGGQALVRTAPIGALLGIMPWNFPYYQVARFAAPNLLLGNTILLKHAGNCPQQALRLAELIAEAGAPQGVYVNLLASNDQVADLIAAPELQGVSLTGSERAGAAVGALAGQHLKKCVLELGGSDPFLVLSDADLDLAVPAAVSGRYSNAGQACTSSKRIIVDDSVFDEFLVRFVEKAGAWTTGDPREKDTRLGPMSSVAARDELAAQVDDAVAKGATLRLGGEVPDGDGAWYPATVLTDVTPVMRAWHEELFGPAAVIYRAGSVDEAVSLANDSPYGLGAAIFSRDVDAASRLADRLDVGMVGLNTTIKSTPDMPFGGVKNSGVGRELGRFGLDEFANKKLVRIV